jgi:hypothetical protein
MKTTTMFQMISLGALLWVPGLALADELVKPNELTSANNPENLPVAQSDHDPQPRVASPNSDMAGVVKQAGVGGEVAYGRAGVVELGGSAAFTTATGLTAVALSPSFGWFFQNNLELSAILGFNFSKVGGSSSTFMTAVLEPSYHIPFNQTVFGFAGLGVGLGYITRSGIGLALSPRVGANILLGRSGILSPAAFFNYSTVGITGSVQDATVQVYAAYGFQVGYTVML